MFAGFVHRRGSPLGPPPMARKYCVLWGSQLWEYSSEEEAASSLRPESCVEILVSLYFSSSFALLFK